MNKQTTRAFAAGILLSAILFFVLQPFFEKPKQETNPEVKEGYIEISQEEYDGLVKEIESYEAKNKELATAVENAKKETEEKTPTIVHYELQIKEGMTSNDISELLQKEKIIKDAHSFNEYLADRNLQEYVQIGTFHLTDQMSEREIAKMITRER